MSSMEPDKSDSIAPLDKSLQSMRSDDEEQWYWKMRSIYRVPARITAPNREAYQSQVVSFGPYHHGEAHLLPMEEHKHRAVRHFLKRSKKPMERFFESLREVAQDLEESYDALDPKWKAGSSEGAARLFLELMITDGCFMLEILRFATNEVDDYAPNDPIFSYHRTIHIMTDICKDMLMLENQLPILVLDRLVAVESDGKKDDEFVSRLLLKVFPLLSRGITRSGKCLHVLDVLRNSMLMEPEKKDEEDDESVNRFILKFRSPSKGITWMGKCLHVLDVVRNSMLMEPKKKDEVKREDIREIIQLASATELSEHGIKFKRSKTDGNKDISFAGGALTLPKIWVDESTMSNFLNFTAFEYLHVGIENEVMSYIYCMDQIINTGQDVALLRAQGIIGNYLESDEAVDKMFNSLGKVVTINPSRSLRDVLEKVNKYRNKRWNRWRANLIHTYLRNPWVALSLIAAVFLFALTIIQTVYSVLGYYK
ncbi:UPF0481 protein At3g47200 [Eucalyptus grandis]|uniref:UPF0481 protein At3g47200 n=1 Tax=Eucalyptus grandis TaxID=71139 RepID=UPI00192EE59C|nr:UPF0481 protein At3g47200 [Eucalyptus grandis]